MSRKPRIVNLAEEKPPKVSRKKAKPQSGENNTRKPRAQKNLSKVKMQPEQQDFQLPDELQLPPLKNQPSGYSWGGLFLAALGGLLSLGIGLAIDQLIRELFARQSWLGWVAAVLTFVLVIGACAIIMREIWGISRLNTITSLRKRAANVHNGEQPAMGERVARDLNALYANRPDMARSQSRFEEQKAGIIDGEDILTLFETTILATADERAKKLVMQSAKRVSVVTAISPRAIVDIAYVLMENIRLIRRISHLYGGRPGALGFWRLTRNIMGHLAVTGAIAAGDSLIQQFVGHGLAARLSTKLGEGIVNGLLTARIGIAAMDQARPMEFHAVSRPGVSEFFTELSRSFSGSNKTSDTD